MVVYTADLKETCSNGYAYHVEGKSLTEVRKKAIAKFKNARWHKTASPPICSVRMWSNNLGSLYRLYGQPVGRIDIQKWYDGSVSHIFIWQPENGKQSFDEERLIKENGELGMTRKAFRKNRERSYRGFRGY